MAKRAPRLQFTEEERASPELAPAIQKADKQIKKLEKAEAKVPKKEVKQRVVDSDGKITTRLCSGFPVVHQPVFLLLSDVPGRKLFHCRFHLSVSG